MATATDEVAENAISTTASRAWWRTRRTTGGAERAGSPATRGADVVTLIGSTPLVAR